MDCPLEFGPLLSLSSAGTRMADQSEAPTTMEATRRLQKAIESAKAGDTKEALSGNLFVQQTIFAELLKKEQEEHAKLLEQVRGMSKEIESKDEEIRNLKTESDLCKARARHCLQVILTQAGKPTIAFTRRSEWRLSDLIESYARCTDQVGRRFLVISNLRSQCRELIAQPEEVLLAPQPSV